MGLLIPSNTPARRNKNGKFSRRGKYVAIAGKLVKTQPETTKQARPRAPPFRAAARRRAREPLPTDLPPPPGIAVEKPSGRSGAKFFTHFKAMGTTGSLAELRSVESPDLLGDDLDEFAAPAAFYSNQSGILGQARWGGIVALDVLIDRLNDALQFVGEIREDFDFRRAYPRWEYRYQVTEIIGDTRRVIAFKMQRR